MFNNRKKYKNSETENKSKVQALILLFVKDIEHKFFKELFSKLDADEVLNFEEIILANKLSPQLFSFISNNNLSELMSEEFLEKIKYQTKRFQLHALEIVREVSIINEIFKREGLSPIYLKGVALQHEYHDVVFRPLVDIDILFSKDELLKAYEALRQNIGLRPFGDNYLNRDNIAYFCEVNHHINLVTDNDISIQLHHRLSPIKQFICCPITDEMFKNNRQINYFGEEINVPSIENIIIHQLVHFSLNHDFKKLFRTINDIRQLVEAYKINWLDVILKCDNDKIRRSICLSLIIIDECGVPIKNLSKMQLLLKDYFPKQEIVKKAQLKLIETRESKYEEFLLPRLLPRNLLDTIYKLLLPKKGELILRFKISKPNLNNLSVAYVKNFISQIIKLKYLFSIVKMIRDPEHNLEAKNPITIWIDKG